MIGICITNNRSRNENGKHLPYRQKNLSPKNAENEKPATATNLVLW
jgi:hypothetical protein